MMGNSCFFIHNENLSPFTGPHMKQKLFSNSNIFFSTITVLLLFSYRTCFVTVSDINMFFQLYIFFRTTTFSNGGSCRMLVPTSQAIAGVLERVFDRSGLPETAGPGGVEMG